MLKQSLPERVAEVLRGEISSGHWRGWLPAERSLALTLGVSRNTLRAALRRLGADGTVVPVRGQGYRLGGPTRKGSIDKTRKPGKTRAVKSRTVMILAPEPLAWLRPVVGWTMNELRVYLFKAGLEMEVHSGKHYYRAGSAPLLDRLVSRHPAACWILLRANEGMQRWFDGRGVTCLVSGTTFPGVTLPSVDVDMGAVGAHAVGRFLAAGHRRLLLVVEAAGQSGAGTTECAEGFVAAAGKRSGVVAGVIRHAGDIAELRRMLHRALIRKPRPTAVLVASSYYYLTVCGVLHEMGLRVPQDVSLICTDPDHFLPYLVPLPAHYAFNHQTFAHKLAQRVGKLVNGEPVKVQKVKIFPNFAPGGSLGPPPKGGV